MHVKSQPANQSEQTGLWFQTEGEKRCCSTGSMRKIKSFLNIKAWRHVTVDKHITNMNRKTSIICPLFKKKVCRSYWGCSLGALESYSSSLHAGEHICYKLNIPNLYSSLVSSTQSVPVFAIWIPSNQSCDFLDVPPHGSYLGFPHISMGNCEIHLGSYRSEAFCLKLEGTRSSINNPYIARDLAFWYST